MIDGLYLVPQCFANGIKTQQIHADTTSFSVSGRYSVAGAGAVPEVGAGLRSSETP